MSDISWDILDEVNIKVAWRLVSKDMSKVFFNSLMGQSLQFCTMRQCGTLKCEFFCLRFYCKKLLHACLYVLVVNKNDMGKAPSPFCIL